MTAWNVITDTYAAYFMEEWPKLKYLPGFQKKKCRKKKNYDVRHSSSACWTVPRR